MPDKGPCPHENFVSTVNVSRFANMPGVFAADIRIACADCGVQLEFVGLPVGVSFIRPTRGGDATEMHAPLVQPGTNVAPQIAQYSVRARGVLAGKDLN